MNDSEIFAAVSAECFIDAHHTIAVGVELYEFSTAFYRDQLGLAALPDSKLIKPIMRGDPRSTTTGRFDRDYRVQERALAAVVFTDLEPQLYLVRFYWQIQLFDDGILLPPKFAGAAIGEACHATPEVHHCQAWEVVHVPPH